MNCPCEASYAPDKTTNYEIGVHSQFGDYLIVNGAIYYIEWSDVQVGSTTVNGAQPIITNGNDAESTGLEVSSQYFVTPSLSFSGSYAYTDAQLTQDAPGIVGGADAYSGDRLPGSPEHQVYVAAHYELPLRDGSQLNFDWSMSYQSDVLTKVGERNFGESMPSFYLNNISTSWLKDDWMVTLYADNVFDEYAQTGVRADTSFIGESGDFTLRRYYHNMVRPRQVGLKFVYNFEN